MKLLFDVKSEDEHREESTSQLAIMDVGGEHIEMISSFVDIIDREGLESIAVEAQNIQLSFSQCLMKLFSWYKLKPSTILKYLDSFYMGSLFDGDEVEGAKILLEVYSEHVKVVYFNREKKTSEIIPLDIFFNPEINTDRIFFRGELYSAEDDNSLGLKYFRDEITEKRMSWFFSDDDVERYPECIKSAKKGEARLNTQ